MEGAAGGEREIERGHAEVEGERLEQRVAGAVLQPRLAEPLPHPRQIVEHLAVLHGHALGGAGGARGVDDVRQVVRYRAALRRGAGGGGEPVLQLLQQQDGRPGSGEPAVVGAGGDDHHRPGVGEHVAEPGAGLLRVERYVRGPRPEHREQRHGLFGALVEADTDQPAGSGARRPQQMRQPVGTPDEFAEGDLPGAVHQGDRVRGTGGLCADRVGERPCRRLGRAGVVPLDEHPPALLGREQAEGVHGRVRVRGGAREDPFPVAGEPGDRAGVPQVGAVGDEGVQPTVGLGAVEAEFEVDPAAVEGEVPPLRFGADGPPAVVLEREGDLEERRAAEVARQVQLLHQPLERGFLVLLGAERRGTHPGEHGGEAGGAGESVRVGPAAPALIAAGGAQFGAQRQHGAEQPDQALGLLGGTPGEGGAHREVGLPRPAAEHHLEGGQQCHVQGGAPGPGEPPGGLVGAGADPEGVGGAPGARHRGPRPVGGQVQGRHPGHRVRPVPQRPRGLRPVLPLALTVREVPVAQRGFTGFRAGAGDQPFVAGEQLVEQHTAGPAVAGEMVLADHQHMVVLGEAQQQRPQQRSARHVEGPGDLGLHRTPGRRLPPGPGRPGQLPHLPGHGELPGRRDPYQRRPVVVRREGAAERLVPDGHQPQRLRQGVRPQRAAQPAGHGQHIGGGARGELFDEPQPLLGERQRYGRTRRQRRDGGGPVGGGRTFAQLPGEQRALLGGERRTGPPGGGGGRGGAGLLRCGGGRGEVHAFHQFSSASSSAATASATAATVGSS
jgi:hypothetical protein